MTDITNKFLRKPEWFKVKSNGDNDNTEIKEMLRKLNLHTVCEEAGCPNSGECFGKKTVTFMILGKNCTRNCRFCNVTKGTPTLVDECEPQNIADAVAKLKLRHVVITSVTRDDLKDGGAGHFANVIKAIKEKLKEKAPVIEVLIPDFLGDFDALKTVMDAKPDIINHNIETVPMLYSAVRPMAIYERSLQLIKRVDDNSDIITKSGIMVGLGETSEQVKTVIKDLHENGCQLLTIGQYLAPSKQHYPVAEYVNPTVFEDYKAFAYQTGFKYVASAPLVRSSYLAENAYLKIMKK